MKIDLAKQAYKQSFNAIQNAQAQNLYDEFSRSFLEKSASKP